MLDEVGRWLSASFDQIYQNVSTWPLSQSAAFILAAGGIAQLLHILLNMRKKKAHANGFTDEAFLLVLGGVAALIVLYFGEAVLASLKIPLPWFATILAPAVVGGVFALLALVAVYQRDSFTWKRFFRIAGTPLLMGALISMGSPIRDIARLLLHTLA